MQWDRFFDDLEDQLAAQYEAERVALDSEAERVRLARMPLRDRLAALVGPEKLNATVGLALADGTVLSAAITGLGADWVAVELRERGGMGVLVPLAALMSVAVSHPDLLRSAQPMTSAPAALSDRIGFGFVLRDLVRRRVPVTVQLHSGVTLSGTIDRAGVDHVDLALHDIGVPRRADAVLGYRLVPLAAVLWVRIDAAGSRSAV